MMHFLAAANNIIWHQFEWSVWPELILIKNSILWFAFAPTAAMLPFIAPLLALLGFSLMFPTRIYFTSVTRSNECGLVCTFERFSAHVQDTLQAVLESEECIERLVCNVNHLVDEIRLAYRFPPGRNMTFVGLFECQKLRCYFLPLLRDTFNTLLDGQVPSGVFELLAGKNATTTTSANNDDVVPP